MWADDALHSHDNPVVDAPFVFIFIFLVVFWFYYGVRKYKYRRSFSPDKSNIRSTKSRIAKDFDMNSYTASRTTAMFLGFSFLFVFGWSAMIQRLKPALTGRPGMQHSLFTVSLYLC